MRVLGWEVVRVYDASGCQVGVGFGLACVCVAVWDGEWNVVNEYPQLSCWRGCLRGTLLASDAGVY